MHPMIKPSLRRGWRDQKTVRYGVTPAHSVLFGPLDPATESFLSLLDGTRGLPALRDAAASLGLGAEAADRVTSKLAGAGVLDDATAEPQAAGEITDAMRPDLASLSLLHSRPGDGLRAWMARRTARVLVRGAGRVGAAVAGALAQAGVGRVEVADGGRVALTDTSHGGLRPESVGERRASAAQALVRSLCPWRRVPTEERRGPRLVIIAPRDGLAAYVPDPKRDEELMASRTPHLYAGVVEATGFVGPLVLPGTTACAGCLLRTLGDWEPSWPILVSQWRNARSPGVPACDSALATTIAGLTACAALAFLDGHASLPAHSRTEYVLPGPTPTTQTFSPHPECSCGAAPAEAPRPSTPAGPQ
ncbi:ThiF family adenylyltransferase [Streptomyces sp. 3MP-14]|uniref:ThiF family adenylyltransferase n=1 Tax=Streptomyces mimosae TaxID=2586635 RepID=A0A5N6ATX8_9ACTN|nr:MULTISPECIES: ThiF family adenylyltransferase [Streptomyces]KAB8171178.1 ThiF family adenylyltransferase [Streptomyces mimosae]KAB8179470.1 ThiF family adenylyltransferase [Streptomyces sp. 3MP-14]